MIEMLDSVLADLLAMLLFSVELLLLLLLVVAVAGGAVHLVAWLDMWRKRGSLTGSELVEACWMSVCV